MDRLIELVHSYHVKDKMLIGFSSTWMDAVTITKWTKQFGDRLNCYPDNSGSIIEIKDVTYHEFLELFMEYFDSLKGIRRVKILYKGSDNRHRNNLLKPRIDLYMYSEA